jgi:ABC-type sugar transport system substrate-binding protein
MTKGVMQEQRRLCPSACRVRHVTFDLPTMATRLPQQTANFALSNPNTEYYIASFDTAATFIVQGLRTANSKARVIGANGNPPNLDLIRQGGAQIATVAYPDAGFLGWEVVDQIGRLLLGQRSARTREIPVQVIDYTNVGRDNSMAQVFPKLVGYEAQYRRMWRLRS